MSQIATRRERVVLELTDDFTTHMARAAAQAAALAAALNSIDGSGRKASTSMDRTLGSTRRMAADVDKVSVVATKADRSINQLTGRIRLLGDIAAVLGPGLVPIGAVGIPALSGLAAGFGFAATAGVTMIGAFQGVGDALKAMNKAALEPTEANLAAAKQAMQEISPAARNFVRELRDMGPALKSLRDIGAAEMFPGFTAGLDALEGRLPDAQRIMAAVAGELGDIGESVGESFASERWDDFFEFLETETPKALEEIAAATGNVTHAMAEMWMAFDPLNDDFSDWLVDTTKGLDEWAMGLDSSQGFQEFIDYVRTTGPQVADTFGAIASALVQIVQAAAPLGGPVLQGLEAVAKAIGAIADSDLGTPIFTALAALALYNRTLGKTSPLMQGAFGTKAKASVAAYGSSLLGVVSAQERASTAAGKLASTQSRQRAAFAKGAAGIGALALVSTGAADGLGVTNTAMLGLLGTMGGVPGVIAGASVGAFLDLTHANDGLNDSLERLNTVAGQVDLSTFNKALEDAKKHVDDFSNVSGVGDAISDTLKAFGGQLSGKGGFWEQKSNNQAQIDSAIGAQNWANTVKEMQSAAAAGARFASASAAGLNLTAAGAREAAGGMKELTAAFAAANAVMSRQGSWDNYRMALLDAKDAVAETGKTLNKNGTIIRGQGRDMQRLGLTSRQTLRGMAAGAAETASKMADFGRRTKFLQQARRDFVQLAGPNCMGMSVKAARALATQLGLIPRITKPKVEEQGSEASRKRIAKMQAEIQKLKNKLVGINEKGALAARQRIAQLRAEIARLQSKTVTTTLITHRINKNTNTGGVGRPENSARGNIFQYAYGDVANRHMPELAGPGPTRVWREPETMGEAYIPLANDDRRPRARAIAAETVAILGGTAYFANGGVVGGGRRGDNDGVARNLNKLRDALRESVKELNKEKATRASLNERRKALAGNVRDKFLTDPFEGGNVWAAGGGNPLGILKGDIAKANAFKSTLYHLKKGGLKGDALAAIAQSGDLGQAQALLGMGKAGLSQYQTLYGQRATAASAVGQYAGSSAYGGLQVETNREIRLLTKEVKTLKKQLGRQHKDGKGRGKDNAREFGKELNRRAGNAKRRSRGR